MIVTLDAWNRDNQYFEARFEKTKATICVGIENVQPIKEGEPIVDPRDNLQVGRDEEVLIHEPKCSAKLNVVDGEKRTRSGIISDQVHPDHQIFSRQSGKT